MSIRTWFLMAILVGALSAVAWAVYGGRLPPADFTFVNESEIKSVDPAIITGIPESRISGALFEGLARERAEDSQAEPGMAQSWDISEDRRVYTFHLRQNALWSNGDPVTARDFHYSLRRLLDPLTAAEYSYQAWYIVNAKRYSYGTNGIHLGDPVEVELNPPENATNTVRGSLLHGKLERIDQAGNKSDDEPTEKTFVVAIDGKERRFKVADDDAELPEGVEPCRQVLLDFREVGIRVIDDYTLEIRLENPTPYFLELVAFHALSPVHQGCVEQFGRPAWTKPENIVTNGPFRLKERRIRDRIRLERSDKYWDKENVRLNVVDALSIEDRTTALNLFMTGASDWSTQPPPVATRELRARRPPPNYLNPAPQLTTYFYLLNTTRPPLNDVRVRRALGLAIDREEIVRVATACGEPQALSLVPPGLLGYTQQKCPERNPEEARKLLAEAGFPGGAGFPKLEIHYNSDSVHQSIAELVRKQWQRELGINITLRNEEWAAAQATQHALDFMISRRAWVGDYLDPNTFLDLYVSDGENNCTGYNNPEYDQLIADAAKEIDETKRMEMLEHAERILMDDMPIIPIYFYVSRNLVKPKVRNFYNNLRDNHPIRAISIDETVDVHSPEPNEYKRSQP